MTGVALLPRELVNAFVAVEIAWGANLAADPATWTWTDVTTFVQFSNPVQITPLGKSDEFATAQPAGCKLRVDNSTGNFSKGPRSVNYPYVRRNVPLRVRVSLDNGSTWDVRFQGNVTGFTPSTITTGKVPMVDITANGIMRRLGLQNSPLKSPLFRAVVTTAALLAFWPMEDSTGATQASSAVGSNTMASTGAVTFNPGQGPAGAAGCVSVPPAAYLRGSVPAYTDTGFWAVNIWTKMPVVAASQVEIVVAKWYTDNGSWSLKALWLSATSLTWGWNLSWTDNTGTGHNWDTRQFFVGTSVGSPINPFDGAWNSINFTAEKSGSDLRGHLWVNGVMVMSVTVTGQWAGTVNTFEVGDSEFSALTQINYTSAAQACGLSVWTDASSDWRNSVADPLYNPGIGWAGETATNRLTRICLENNVPLSLTGSSTTAMGPQPIDTFMNVVRECEATDGGVLYDGLGPGLGYITLSSRYNQVAGLTLDASLGQVDDPFQPVDDDQGVKNRVTAKNKSGGQVTAEDVNGPQGTATIGAYEVQPTVNTATDSPLVNIAGWQLRLGTVDEPYRYPTLNLNFRAAPSKAAGWLALALAGRIDVTNVRNVTSQYPDGTISLVVNGYTETISPYQWTVTANCSAYQPWNVATVEGTLRLGLDGQTLASGLASGATTLSLATVAGKPLLTLTPADFPMDLNVAGWTITATGASGASSPQTVTINPAPNVSTIPSTTPVTLWRPAALAL